MHFPLPTPILVIITKLEWAALSLRTKGNWQSCFFRTFLPGVWHTTAVSHKIPIKGMAGGKEKEHGQQRDQDKSRGASKSKFGGSSSRKTYLFSQNNKSNRDALVQGRFIEMSI